MKLFIYGAPGAGKSTLALKLSAESGLACYHLDHYFFKAPNIHQNFDKAMAELKETLPEDNWIIEGNHGAALEFLAARADYIIILDVRPVICTYRIIKRYFQNDLPLKKAVSKGWEEALSRQFIWLCFWEFPKIFPHHLKKIKAASKTPIIHIKDGGLLALENILEMAHKAGDDDTDYG